MLIDVKLLDEVTAKAQANERLRMNYNLHTLVVREEGMGERRKGSNNCCLL